MNYLTYDNEFLIRNGGLHTAMEICQQPEIWEEAVLNIIKNKEKISAFMDKVLDFKNLRIIITGAGSSAFAGEMLMPYLNTKLGKVVEAIATTDLVATPYYYFLKKVPTLYISYGRSGDSPESLAASKLGESIVDAFYEIIVTCNAEGELAHSCENNDKKLLLLMPEQANDKGFAMTSSFTCMALSTLAISNLHRIDDFLADVRSMAAAVRSFITRELDNIKTLSSMNFERYTSLGSGMLRGMSRESALKMLELTGGKVGTSYDTPLAFRHGPKSIVNNDTLTVFYLSGHPHTLLYDTDLINEMYNEKKENLLVVVGNKISNELKVKCDCYFDVDLPVFKLESEMYLPFAYLIFAHILSFNKSLRLEISPDNPCPTGQVNRVVKGVTIHPYA